MNLRAGSKPGKTHGKAERWAGFRAAAFFLAAGIVVLASHGSCHRSGSRDPTFEEVFGLSLEEAYALGVGRWVSTGPHALELEFERHPTGQVLWDPGGCTSCEGNSNGCTPGYAWLPLTGRFKAPLQTGWQEREGAIWLDPGSPYLRVSLYAVDATDTVSGDIRVADPSVMAVTYQSGTYYLTRSGGVAR